MSTKSFVIVKFNDGRIKIWPDYGEGWGSPAYEVLGYRDSHKAARSFVAEWKRLAEMNEASPELI